MSGNGRSGGGLANGDGDGDGDGDGEASRGDGGNGGSPRTGDSDAGGDGVSDADCMSLQIEGETLVLHPQRAVLWPRRRTLIVADTHFGKSAVFRRNGLAVPAGSDDHDRERLSRLVSGTRAERLIILGDFVHAPLDPASRDACDLEAWIDSWRSLEIVVIAGNHDRGPSRWRPPVRWQEGDMSEPPFRFIHDADCLPRHCQDSFTLSGHLHPVAKLGGLRKRAPRIPIFWQRGSGLVLPSFGIFTGGYLVTPQVGDRVYAAGPDRIVRFR